MTERIRWRRVSEYGVGRKQGTEDRVNVMSACYDKCFGEENHGIFYAHITCKILLVLSYRNISGKLEGL